jgi:D-glycero-alpha-D-manno-heptose-7-phosphate kinase
MIVAKTPLRIPIAGGLTDLKHYAAKFGGVTVSSTIDKYIYVMLKENLGGYFRLRYQDVGEKVSEVAHIKNDLIREAVKLTGLEDQPLDLVIMADLAGESGLGTSGAVCVTLLNAMHAFKGEDVSKQQLLEEASRIEVEILEGASGYHDPSICALGGLKLIEYKGYKVSARDIDTLQATKRAFEQSMLYFYGGRHAKSKPSLALLSSHMDEALEVLHQIKSIGYELEDAFREGNLQRIAEIMGEQQQLKQQLPGKFSDDYVNDIVKRVRETGAYAQLPGGKISAFVMVCCPNGQHNAVREALKDLNEMTFHLEAEGTRVSEI